MIASLARRSAQLGLVCLLVACVAEPVGVNGGSDKEPPASASAPEGNDAGMDEPGEAPDERYLARYNEDVRPVQANTVIGPEGGSLRADDFELIVPPGAVDRPTLFRIRLPASVGKGRGAYAHFEATRTFTLPVTIRLPFASTNAAPGAPVLWWDDDHWEPLATTPTADGRIEATATHFSVYGTSRFKGITPLGG